MGEGKAFEARGEKDGEKSTSGLLSQSQELLGSGKLGSAAAGLDRSASALNTMTNILPDFHILHRESTSASADDGKLSPGIAAASGALVGFAYGAAPVFRLPASIFWSEATRLPTLGKIALWTAGGALLLGEGTHLIQKYFPAKEESATKAGRF